MRHPHQAMAGCCRRLKMWRFMIAAGAGVLLAGCTSPLSRPPAHALQLPSRQPSAPGSVPTRAPVWRIAQARTDDVPAFRVVANEPPPTPKTLASGAPIARSAIAAPETATPGPSASLVGASGAPRAATRTRVREPVGTVYFGPAGAHVSTVELRTVAAAVARITQADRLVLTAYTDPHGSLELNQRLAGLRADSVAAALVARGVDPAHVIVLSRPQCCASRPLPEHDAALYRRVEIERLAQRPALPPGGDDVQRRPS